MQGYLNSIIKNIPFFKNVEGEYTTVYREAINGCTFAFVGYRHGSWIYRSSFDGKSSAFIFAYYDDEQHSDARTKQNEELCLFFLQFGIGDYSNSVVQMIKASCNMREAFCMSNFFRKNATQSSRTFGMESECIFYNEGCDRCNRRTMGVLRMMRKKESKQHELGSIAV